MRSPRLLLLALAAGASWALENPITGARQLGMGASGIAATGDHTTPWWNAAALGWEAAAGGGPQAGWGTLSPGGAGLEAQAGVHVYGTLVQDADALRRMATRIRALGVTGVTTTADVEDFLTVAKRLKDIGSPANSIGADANLAASFRFGRFSIGVRAGGEAYAWGDDVDLRHVMPGVNGGTLADRINTAGGAQDGATLLLSDSQRDQIYAALGGGGAFNGTTAAGLATYRLDRALRDMGQAAPSAADATTWIASTLTSTGTLDQNTTSVVIQSFSYVEVPISLGVPVNEHVSFGGSLKLIAGRVHGTRILVFQEDVESELADLKGANRDTVNLGLDLGMLVRAGDWRLAATGRNLNAPTFAGPSEGRDVRLDPQVTFGAAWMPAPWFTLTADIDQLSVSTMTPAYESRHAGAGIELAAIPWVDLRFGAYANLADSGSPPVVTAGVGLGPSWLHADVSLAAATEMEDLGDYRVPGDMRVAVGLSGQW